MFFLLSLYRGSLYKTNREIDLNNGTGRTPSETEINMKKVIALNDRGRRIGEGHPRAKLLDREVEQVLALLATGMSYVAVAEKFDVSKSCIAHIASGRRRSQAIETVRRVSV